MDTAQSNKLRQKIQGAQLPQDVLERATEELNRLDNLQKAGQYSAETDRQMNYLNLVADLPWNKLSTDILDLTRARQILDKNHYGLDSVKERILEYLSILILNKQKGLTPHSTILAFAGLVGSGKTSLAYSIAESLGRSIIRIPFGGLGSALQLRGESRVKPDAEPGLIIKALIRSGVKNPVILLDELDRVVDESRADIMGVLVEVLDPEQNSSFLDHYLDMPFDLSQVLFLATANNLTNVSTAVLDRLEIIEMPFYSDEQKVIIAKQYLLPQALKSAGLEGGVITVDEALWGNIVRPLGFDGGIRSLKRNIEALVRKVALQVVEGKVGPYQINEANIKEYIA